MIKNLYSSLHERLGHSKMRQTLTSQSFSLEPSALEPSAFRYKSSAIADRQNQGYLGKAMTPDIDVDFCSIKTNSNC